MNKQKYIDTWVDGEGNLEDLNQLLESQERGLPKGLSNQAYHKAKECTYGDFVAWWDNQQKDNIKPITYNEELLKELWYARNPAHDFNCSTGEDMFWRTAFMVFEDYLKANNTEEKEQPKEKVKTLECPDCGSGHLYGNFELGWKCRDCGKSFQ